ncbi:hypothetical protein [Paracoccus sp. S1E-3]|uniref:hypothetical protein n=1 Tax=Paracoccus sp. S1E-3 TaxID=2756130 RepID=UPI0015EFB520|nr:hypothetical protein [Paracoccus sp. S1E-3]MBA4491115.1 hypothetical protein [Paracoccus sp. S1E-3]
MTDFRPLAAFHAAIITVLALPASAQTAVSANDFPTEDRVRFVLLCMEANGHSPENLRRCSCKIDEIGALISFDDYVAGETVLRMQQVPGDRASMYRGAGMLSAAVDKLRSADAEAELVCF